MADAHEKYHDYHLVNPSPWPLVGALSAFIMALGGIMWMKAMPLAGLKMGREIFGLGVMGVLFTAFSWWADIIDEAHAGDHTPVVGIHLRYGMILFIASEVMFFVGWFWAYFDAALYSSEAIQFTRSEFTGAVWPPKGIETFNPWELPLLNTIILLTSGTTVTWAHHALLEGNRKGLIQGLTLTVILGVLFTTCQIFEYSHAHFGFKDHIYGATFFMATGFHGFHVLIGTIFLFVCLIRALKGDFTPKQHFGFEAAAWYWHFVDVVWLFLFAAIYVWGYGGPVVGAAH